MASQSAQTATANGRDKAVAASAADIEERMEKLRGDIVLLTEAVSSFGSAKSGQVKDRAAEKVDAMRAMSEDALDTLRAEFRNLEKGTRKQIQTNPLQAVAVAAGVGFLTALLLRK